jgi:hypothetical protein
VPEDETGAAAAPDEEAGRSVSGDREVEPAREDDPTPDDPAIGENEGPEASPASPDDLPSLSDAARVIASMPSKGVLKNYGSLFRAAQKNSALIAALTSTPVNIDLRNFETAEMRQLKVSREMATTQEKQTELLGNLVDQQARQIGALVAVAEQGRRASIVNWLILGVAIATLMTAIIVGAREGGSSSGADRLAQSPSPTASAAGEQQQ